MEDQGKDIWLAQVRTQIASILQHIVTGFHTSALVVQWNSCYACSFNTESVYTCHANKNISWHYTK